MNKKSILFLVLLITVLFSGCVTQKVTNQAEAIIPFGIDFREYVEKGFLFMPDEYFGEYEVKGMITVELHPKVQYMKGKIPKGDGFEVQNFFINNEQMTKMVMDVKMDDLIKYIYDLATEWGGDAFTHFDSSLKTGFTDSNSPATNYPYYSVSGIVVKRK